MKKENKKIELTESEQAAVANQRLVEEKKQAFADAYKQLVAEHGFAVAVAMNSPLNNPSLTVVAVG